MNAPNQAYPKGPQMINTEPSYTRRCGFYFFCVWILFSIIMGARAVMGLISKREIQALHVFELASSFLSILLISWILYDKKLTTEKGHFWKLYCATFIAGIPNFVIFVKHPAKSLRIPLGIVETVIAGTILAFINGFIVTFIWTMDEEYDGCCACLKCVKPYKVDQVMPSFYEAPQK